MRSTLHKPHIPYGDLFDPTLEFFTIRKNPLETKLWNCTDTKQLLVTRFVFCSLSYAWNITDKYNVVLPQRNTGWLQPTYFVLHKLLLSSWSQRCMIKGAQT